MFSRFNQLIYVGCAIAMLGLGSRLWIQEQQIESLKADNQTQAQTIRQLELEQATLHQALKAEQQAVENQQKLTNQFKNEMESKREKVRVIFKNSPCANAQLPRGVIEQLQ